MKKTKNGNLAIFTALATASIILISVLAILFANQLFSINKAFVAQTSQSLFLLRAFLSLTSIGFSAYLIYVYLNSYVELRSSFTLALLLAVISFMLFSLTTNPFLQAACGVVSQTDIYSIIPLAFATIAMAILAWASSK